MCLYVNRCHAEECIERYHAIEETAVLGVPYKKHYYRAYSHMAARECCRRALSCRLRVFNQLVEYAIGLTRARQTVCVRIEIVVEIREHSGCYLVYANGFIIECRSGDGYKHEDYVIGKE